MGKKWDHDRGGRDQWIAWMQQAAQECLRVTKPGGHALVWALPRTSHWTGMAWELAGWEVRDKCYHAFGTRFPKSLDVSKSLDKAAGAERTKGAREWQGGQRAAGILGKNLGTQTRTIYDSPSTDAAKQWEGWGTALKPAIEEWLLLRKPLAEGTVAANILEWGTGGINIDACRVRSIDGYTENAVTQGLSTARTSYEPRRERRTFEPSNAGRWPANLVHDGSPEVVALFPVTGG